MDAEHDAPGTQRAPRRLTASRTILLATALGLCGGYLDLIVIAFKKYYVHELRYFWSGSDFPWSVPVAHAATLAVAGAVVAVVDRLRPGGPRSTRATAWLFATLAIWSALLRLPLYGACSLLLAAGLGRPVSLASVACGRWPRRVLAGLAGVLLILATASTAPRVARAYRASGLAPAPPAGARNVILIVWDTVRLPSSSLYGYGRDTTPRLREWARRGVTYAMPLVPAPWTYPSHSSIFTGRWPYQLDSQWNFALDDTYPTLAEFLASRGYQTAAFVANTRGCSYETGLDRGFALYQDYPLSPRFLLGRTAPGSWLLRTFLARGDFYQAKWIEVQSRDARGINQEFLGWLGRRRSDRPFFAFLNYYDAHSPYVPPAEYAGRFGIRPRDPEDYRLLFDFTRLATGTDWRRNFLMARDCYDACIASLDEQLGRLLDALSSRGLLDETLVIVTSDHGESFGDHRVFGHGAALYLDQTAVPLVILDPDAPSGRTVTAPVSLRDLAATVVDRLGLSAGSPFPGRSLAALWSPGAGKPPPAITPAFSEMAQARAFRTPPPDFESREGLQMSLVAPGWHYMRDVRGPEKLHDLRRDPSELVNIADRAGVEPVLAAFRRELLDILTAAPGSSALEASYLGSCRRRLEAAVRAGPPTIGAGTASASR